MMSKPLIDELFKVMKKKRLSIVETAKMLGCGRRKLQRWHIGKHYPKSLYHVRELMGMIEDLKKKGKTDRRFEWGTIAKPKKISAAFISKEAGRVFKKTFSNPKSEIRKRKEIHNAK